MFFWAWGTDGKLQSIRFDSSQGSWLHFIPISLSHLIYLHTPSNKRHEMSPKNKCLSNINNVIPALFCHQMPYQLLQKSTFVSLCLLWMKLPPGNDKPNNLIYTNLQWLCWINLDCIWKVFQGSHRAGQSFLMLFTNIRMCANTFSGNGSRQWTDCSPWSTRRWWAPSWAVMFKTFNNKSIHMKLHYKGRLGQQWQDLGLQLTHI